MGRSEDNHNARHPVRNAVQSIRRSDLTGREVSEMTGVRPETLRFLWLTGQGPAYRMEQGRVLCQFEDVLKFQAMRRAAHARLMATYRGTTE